MSNIYCDEDVIDFTNPFLDFDQGYQAPRTSPEHPENYNANRLLALIATGSSALGFDCNSVPLVVRASRSWGLVSMWVLDIVIPSFES